MKKNPELSVETIDAIEKARQRIKSGNFVTEEEAMKIFLNKSIPQKK